MNGQPVRVALVEDHAVLAESLLMVLNHEQFLATMVPVTGQHGDAAALLEPILATDPDVVLLDLDLGHGSDGAALIEPLSRHHTQVVVMTGASDPSRWGECLSRGAHAVIQKTAGLDEITESVRRAAHGEPVISATERAELVERWRRRQAQNRSRHLRLDRLTTREGEVLSALARGRSVSDIARSSYVSEATVRTQVKSILGKLGVHSQIAAVAIARDAGWHVEPLEDQPG
jgi:two-component system nitrate/nitrite response regulator NarL